MQDRTAWDGRPSEPDKSGWHWIEDADGLRPLLWRGEDWPDRVRSWLPAGVDAWILQREVVDPAMHVGTWQRDAGLVPSSRSAREQAAAWRKRLESS